MALRSVARKLLRRYNPPVEGQRAAPIECPLSIPTVLLDGLDLIFNLRGIWSWSYKPFPSMSTRSTSIPVIIAKLLFKLVVFHASQYLVQYLRPTVDVPAGDILFDPTLSSMVPCCAWASLYTLFEGVVVFVAMDVSYHASTLVGLILLRQSAWQWPPLFNRPWTSTSITDCWGFRWHQIFRHEFAALSPRPGRALLGWP